MDARPITDHTIRAVLRSTPPAELDAQEREVARALRAAAREVGAAGLPAEYRLAAFRVALERELDRV